MKKWLRITGIFKLLVSIVQARLLTQLNKRFCKVCLRHVGAVWVPVVVVPSFVALQELTWTVPWNASRTGKIWGHSRGTRVGSEDLSVSLAWTLASDFSQPQWSGTDQHNVGLNYSTSHFTADISWQWVEPCRQCEATSLTTVCKVFHSRLCCNETLLGSC